MPTVIGINEVPREIVRPKWYEDMGYAQGKVANQLLMALVGQMAGGGGPLASKNIPNPNYGQAPQARPGVTFEPQGPQANPLARPQVPSQIMPKISTPPGPYANQPMLNQQQFELLQNLQKYQQDQSQERREAEKSILANTQTSQQIEINKGVMSGEVVPITLPTGQTIYMRASKGGLVPIDTGKDKSAHDQAREAEFSGLGAATAPALPEELPNPKGLAEGTRARDTETNQVYIVKKGAWIPQ